MTGLKTEIEKQARLAAESSPDSVRAVTLRLLSCAIRERDVTARADAGTDGCAESEARKVLQTLRQQHVDAREEQVAEGRPDLAEREDEVIAIIDEFLPKPLRGEDLVTAVDTVMKDLEASKLKDMGRCIEALKARYPRQIDPAEAHRIVQDALVNKA